MPAVEKGVRQALADGVTAGFPVEDLRVTVYDGKTHAVDGKEVAFVTAGRKATIEAIRAANPIVLEPIVSIEIVSPEAAIGDLTGDLSSRRGHITGTNPRPGNSASITGEVPLGGNRGLRLAPEVADWRPGCLQHRVRALRPGATAGPTEAGVQLPAQRRGRVTGAKVGAGDAPRERALRRTGALSHNRAA
jgi:hypothetical protein